MTILVTGATGTVGRHLVGQLAAAGHPVRALTRRADPDLPAGVETARGDLTRTETLAPALDGVTALHLITFGGDDFAALPNGAEIVELAAKAGVRRVTVLGGWDEGTVEAALRGGDLGWTHLRPMEFMGNARDWAEAIRADGAIELFGDAPSAAVHEADIAAVAVAALTEDGHAGREYPLSGPEALTPADKIARIAEATGRPVTLIPLTEEGLRNQMRAWGADEDYIEFAVQLQLKPPEIGTRPLPTVEQVTGRPARTFAQWATENAALFRP